MHDAADVYDTLKYRVEVSWVGTRYYYNADGLLHRDGGPAVIGPDGRHLEWYQNGLLHRDGGPALKWANGDEWWYQYGEQHRIDGPAQVGAHTARWFLYGQEYARHEYYRQLKSSES